MMNPNDVGAIPDYSSNITKNLAFMNLGKMFSLG